MSTWQLVVVAVAVFGAAVVNVLAGFGFALLAMPVMTTAMPVERALVVALLLGTLTTWWQTIALRRDIDRPLATRLTLAAFAGMPFGLVVLNVVDDRSLKVVLGVSVLLATALLVRRLGLSHTGPALDWSMGFLSGVLNTSLGTNGPPLVFGLQARQVEPDRFRATIATVFALSNVFAIALFVLDGKITGEGLSAATVAFPALLLGLWLGRRWRGHVVGERFRWLVLGLLLAVGVVSIVFALA